MTVEHESRLGFAKKIISRLHPSHHYEKFTAKAKSLSGDELVAKRRGYDHVKRDTVVRTALGLGVAVGGVIVLGPNLPREVILLSSGPIALGVSLAGPTTGIVREGERDILDEEIKSRGLKPQDAVVYQSKV